MKAPLNRGGAAARNSSTKAWFPLLFLLLGPTTAQADPYDLNPSSLLAFFMVAFWALIVETGIVTLIVAFRGVVVWKMFVAYFIGNAAVFFFVFEPALERGYLPVVALEFIVICLDASVIKFLVSREALQTDGFAGLSWKGAVITSAIGNCCSYMVGYIATKRPWEQ